MKGVLRTGSLVMAAYFLALPFLFAIHVFHHQQAYANANAPEDRAVVIEGVSDCDLCDLYHHQHLAVETSPSFSSAGIYYEPIENGPDGLVVALDHNYYLRGPPVC